MSRHYTKRRAEQKLGGHRIKGDSAKGETWFSVAWTQGDADVVMQAVGTYTDDLPEQQQRCISFGAIIATICREWLARHNGEKP